MLLFVNNKPVKVIESQDLTSKYHGYDVIDLKNKPLDLDQLEGKVLYLNADEKSILKVINMVQPTSSIDFDKLVFVVKDHKKVKNKLKESLKVIAAAGGLVRNKDGKYLMIKRLGYWDLPKGKAELNETSKKTAQREVEEETGVNVKVGEKILTTWHTYKSKSGDSIIKHTKWYHMIAASDKKPKPQIEEGIEEVRWMDEAEVREALKISYASITHIFEKNGFLKSKIVN